MQPCQTTCLPTVSLPSSIEEFVDLIKCCEELGKKSHQYRLIELYVYFSLTTGWHLNHAVILILGLTVRITVSQNSEMSEFTERTCKLWLACSHSILIGELAPLLSVLGHKKHKRHKRPGFFLAWFVCCAIHLSELHAFSCQLLASPVTVKNLQ
jgi:hypothetical protein